MLINFTFSPNTTYQISPANDNHIIVVIDGKSFSCGTVNTGGTEQITIAGDEIDLNDDFWGINVKFEFTAFSTNPNIPTETLIVTNGEFFAVRWVNPNG
jgi:hypothetical protein